MVNSEELGRRVMDALAPELVRAAYRGLLKREADDEGLASYTESLANDWDVAAMLSDITGSDEYRQMYFYTGSPDSQAQNFTVRDLEDQKLVFMHHPKTGGTTLHHILTEAFDKEEVCPERFNGLRFYPAGELARYRFYSGHFDLPSVRLIPGRKKVITMLREPSARLMSLYYFQRAHNPEVYEQYNLELARLANKYSMAEFFGCEEVRQHPWVNNSMTRILVDVNELYRWESPSSSELPDIAPYLSVARKALCSLDAFGIMERYDESVELICWTIGRRVPARIEPRQVLEVIMDEEPRLRRIRKEPVTPEAMRLIESLVQVDRKLYNHASKVFEKRLTALRRRKRR